ncbi:MAG: tetraacyldisaccharide 4'-kinase [Flavobacteriales bacterium]|nr:tetraacyldisaccharide 4'-kinase [Flavobacteriales bacterium]|tara:strand:- start:785 stop:1819 length:1035 start_codon:yes stop_codon:yes gene_type:complete
MSLLRYLLAAVYYATISIRNYLFNASIIKSKKYNIPIVCIGNITIGGTGKTPHSEYILELLSNKNVAYISRGFGRKSKNLIIVEKDLSHFEASDEALQIKNKFPNLLVIVSKKRTEAIEIIKNSFPKIEIIIMDDGFQHRWVNAGLNIILNDYNNPIYEDKILPIGRLRDNVSSIKRANIIITTKCKQNISNSRKSEINNKFNLCNDVKFFFSEIEYGDFYNIFNNDKVIKFKQKNIFLITSIANTDPLITYLNSGNYKIIHHYKFKDHHNYTDSDIKFLKSKLSNYPDNIIVTTEKDKVKLIHYLEDIFGLNIYYIPIKIKIDKKEEFKQEILNYVEEDTTNK